MELIELLSLGGIDLVSVLVVNKSGTAVWRWA